MAEQTAFPEWIASYLLDDAPFSAAYEAVLPAHRAWLKRGLAGLHAWLGHTGVCREHAYTHWKGGYCAVERTEPVEWGMLLLPSGPLSPARVLAAAAPLVFAGVDEVLAVQVIEKSAEMLSNDVLVALELAGVESVAVFEQDSVVSDLLRELSAAGREGCVVAMERRLPQGSCEAGGGAVRTLSLQWSREAGVWCAPDSEWDLEILAWAHPDVHFLLGGQPPAAPPAQMEQVCSGWDAFALMGRDTLYVPHCLVESALGCAGRVFSPGYEGCWVWPELNLDAFLCRRVAFGLEQTD